MDEKLDLCVCDQRSLLSSFSLHLLLHFCNGFLKGSCSFFPVQNPGRCWTLQRWKGNSQVRSTGIVVLCVVVFYYFFFFFFICIMSQKSLSENASSWPCMDLHLCSFGFHLEVCCVCSQTNMNFARLKVIIQPCFQETADSLMVHSVFWNFSSTRLDVCLLTDIRSIPFYKL